MGWLTRRKRVAKSSRKGESPASSPEKEGPGTPSSDASDISEPLPPSSSLGSGAPSAAALDAARKRAAAEELRRKRLAAEAAAINALIAKASHDTQILAERRQSSRKASQSATPVSTQRTDTTKSSTDRSSASSATHAPPAPATQLPDAASIRYGLPPIPASDRPAGVFATLGSPDASSSVHADGSVSCRAELLPRAARADVLITAMPHAESMTMALPSVVQEAHQAQAAFGGPDRAELLLNSSVEALDDALRGRSTWLFAGHGDMLLAGEAVLAFADKASGRLQAVSISTLVQIVRPHVQRGKLRLVMLTGCRTAALAQQLRERAFVPYVLCWETLLLDDAGVVFDQAFASALCAGRGPQRAYEMACRAVTTVTEPGRLDTGEASIVQKYELHVDPSDRRLVDPASGRLLLSTGPRGEGRGRLAVGKPRLLVPDDTQLHGVPALPTHYAPGKTLQEYRDALLKGVCGEGSRQPSPRPVGELGEQPPSPSSSSSAPIRTFTGIAGGAGLGKSALAAALCHDICVRTAFRDGAYWIELGKASDGPAGLERLARLVGLAHHDVEECKRRHANELGDKVARVLRDKHALIVLDDVWYDNQVQPFQRLVGGACILLLTTRRQQVLEAYGSPLCRAAAAPLHPLEPEEARKLLIATSRPEVELIESPDDVYALDALVEMSGGLPAMLRSLGGMCRGRSPRAVQDYFETHEHSRRLPASMARSEGYRIEAARGNLFFAYEEQVNELAAIEPTLVDRLSRLAVLAPGVPWPLHVLMGLWGERGAPLNEAEARDTIERLVQEHLVDLSAAAPVEPEISLSDPPSPSPALHAIRSLHADARPLAPALAPGYTPKYRPYTPPLKHNLARASSLAPAPAATNSLRSSSTSITSPQPSLRSAASSASARSDRGGNANGKTIELLGPTGMYTRWRGKVYLRAGLLHAKVLEGVRQRSIGEAERGYWSAEAFFYHLRIGGSQVRTGSLSSVTLLNLCNVTGRPIGNDGIGMLAAALEKGVLPSLTTLRLQHNEIGDEGLLHLANAVGAGALTKLNTLNISHNAIGDFGFAALVARSVGALRSLMELDASHNDIGGDEGIDALLKAINKGGLSLCSVLDLSHNAVADASLVELAATLEHTPAPPARKPLPYLSLLQLTSNPFGDLGMGALARACTGGALDPRVLVLSPRSMTRLEQMMSDERQGVRTPTGHLASHPPARTNPPLRGPVVSWTGIRRSSSRRGRTAKELAL